MKTYHLHRTIELIHELGPMINKRSFPKYTLTEKIYVVAQGLVLFYQLWQTRQLSEDYGWKIKPPQSNLVDYSDLGVEFRVPVSDYSMGTRQDYYIMFSGYRLIYDQYCLREYDNGRWETI